MKPWIRFGVALVLVAGIGACSDDSGQSYDDTVDGAGAEMAADAVWANAHEMMSGIANNGLVTSASARAKEMLEKARVPAVIPADRLPRGYRADLVRMPEFTTGPSGTTLVAPPGCTYSESGMDGGGTPIDANGNGFPDDYRQTMHC